MPEDHLLQLPVNILPSQGTTMGSHVSPVMANTIMEIHKEIIIERIAKLLSCYIDDIIKKTEVKFF